MCFVNGCLLIDAFAIGSVDDGLYDNDEDSDALYGDGCGACDADDDDDDDDDTDHRNHQSEASLASELL